MRILSILPPSNFPNFQADSLYVFNKILFEEVLRQSDVELFVAAPPSVPREIEGVTYLPMEFGCDQYHTRFGLDWQRASEILQEVRPDVCFVNFPEHAATLALLLRGRLRMVTRIVSYVHYIPAWVDDEDGGTIRYEAPVERAGIGQTCVLRLLEGLVASDQAIIGSAFGKKLLEVLHSKLLGFGSPLPPISILPPPLQDGAWSPNGEDSPDVPYIVYNHRLYDHYGTPDFIRLLKRAKREAVRPFEVLVTNPTAGRGEDRNRIDRSVQENLQRLKELEFVKLTHFGCRRDYYRMIAGSLGGFGPIKPHALWSMSILDLLACGRPVIAFKVGAFPEMLPENMLAASQGEFITLLNKLLSGADGIPTSEHCLEISRHYSADRIASRFVDILKPANARKEVQ